MLEFIMNLLGYETYRQKIEREELIREIAWLEAEKTKLRQHQVAGTSPPVEWEDY